MFVDMNANQQRVVASFSEFTLSNIGDSITFSGEIRIPNPVGGGFRFGLFSSNGTPITGDNTSESDNDYGYQLNIGTPTLNAIGSSKISKDADDTELIGVSDTDLVTASAGFDDDYAYHSFSLTIEMTGASELTISGSWDGSTNATTTMVTTDTSALITSFDEVMIAFADTVSRDHYVDNITVTAVPEPGTYALISGLFGLAFVVWSKRK